MSNETTTAETTETTSEETQPTAKESTNKAMSDRATELEKENAQLRNQIKKNQGDSGGHFAEREATLQGQEQQNAELREQAAKLKLDADLNAAADALDIDRSALQMYKHEFKTHIDDEGKVIVEPNPFEHLARKLKTDALLKDAREVRTRREDNTIALRNPNASARAKLQALDADPAKMRAYLNQHETKGYIQLVTAALNEKRAEAR